jgi:acyl carrier protein
MIGDIEPRLKALLVDQLPYRLDPERILPTSVLHGRGLGLSSLDLVTLIMRVEEEFDVFFEADEMSDAVATFGALLSVTERKVHARSG